MGYDTSYHAVDLPLIQTRLLPYVSGQGSIDDLVEQALLLSKVRFRANAWGLGSKDFPAREPFLHVWGRPFFIVGDDPSAQVDLWNATADMAQQE